jgi:S1-C subfamily serine protease
MKKFQRVILAVIFNCLLTPTVGAQDGVNRAVVKIYTVSQSYDYGKPWQMADQESVSGSGCIIGGKRILTNAHVVGDQTFIQVRKAGDARKYTAEVEIVAHECDLALLSVNDGSFFSGVESLEIGGLAALSDEVAVYGFPMGGDKLCITQGVVSRVEHSTYFHSHADLLACQIDAAINPGSSGGPVIKDGKVVGVAFQGLCGDNIGYMVPAPVIAHFLEDIGDGTYDGIPSLGISYQEMENPDLRLRFGMTENQTGVLVRKIYPDSPASGIVQSGDVILSIDGKDLGDDGTVEFRGGERTSCEYLIQEKHINDTVTLTVFRENEIIHAKVKLTKPINFDRLVPYERYDVAPTYYILGGLVFEPLTKNYLKTWGYDWYNDAPSNLLSYYHYGEPADDRREVILLVKVLAHEINVGCHGLQNKVIAYVNGKKISTMKDLVRAVEQHQGKYHVIVDEQGYRIVLDRKKVEENSQGILVKYKISSDRSRDLQR